MGDADCGLCNGTGNIDDVTPSLNVSDATVFGAQDKIEEESFPKASDELNTSQPEANTENDFDQETDTIAEVIAWLRSP